MPDLEHPDYVELLEWLTNGVEREPARVAEHLAAGCRQCRDDADFLESLGQSLRADAGYDAYFEDLAADHTSERFRDSRAAGLGSTKEQTDDAERLARTLLETMERGPEVFFESLRYVEGRPGGRLAALFALQRAAALVPKCPARVLDAARIVGSRAERPSGERPDGASVRRELLLGEAALLEAQCLTSLGKFDEAIATVQTARLLFEAIDDAGFSLALCDYFEASAASFVRGYARAEALLARAMGVFREFGQEHWTARAEAALATSISQRGGDRAAQPLYDRALEKLDPVLDAHAFIQTLINKASSLAHVGRTDDAKRLYARALSMSLKAGTSGQVHRIRIGLAENDFRDGHYEKALASYRKIAAASREAGYDFDVLLARLYVAECLGRLGRDLEMAEAVRGLREERGGLTKSEALEELFSCLDEGDLTSGVITHVREHLEQPDAASYVPFRKRSTG